MISSVRLQTYERALVALFLVVSASLVCTAQGVPYRVVFRDKGPDRVIPGTAAYDSLLSRFSARAIMRRQRMGLQPPIDSTDAPIYSGYLRDITTPSTVVILELPWFNSVIIECSPSDSTRLAQLPFVSSVMSVHRRSYAPLADYDCAPPSYGNEDLPHQTLGTPPLHNGGVYGDGVLIGVLDTGFRWRSMSSLSSHLRVEREFDMIYGDSSTANDSLDPESQDRHGSMVLSVLAGWQRDSIIGIAPFATYVLAKTEDMRYEHRIEEETYAAAVMQLERSGIDVLTSSLGYRTFDDGQDSTRYSDLNGSTTWAARAVNIAASKGVICVTSAGNDGPASRSIITPADADSVITIGALAQDGVTPWMRSSWGPTADGRQKPEFAAPGVQIRCQDADNSFARPSGTSIAAPLFAGGVALLRELYPHLPPWSIRAALRSAAQRGNSPDSVAGYGAPDITQAARLLGPAVGPPVVSTSDSKRSVLACVYTDRAVRAQLIVRDPITGATSVSAGIRIDDPWYMFPLEQQQVFRDLMHARIEVARTDSSSFASYPRDTTWFDLPRNALIIPCGVRLPGSVTSIDVTSVKNEPRVADHPLSAGSSCFNIHNLEGDYQSISLIHIVSGSRVSTSVEDRSPTELRVCVDAPLVRGAYIVRITYREGHSSIPVLVR